MGGLLQLASMLELVVDGVRYTCEGSWDEMSYRRMVGIMNVMVGDKPHGRMLWDMLRYMLRLKHGMAAWWHQPTQCMMKKPPIWIHHICTVPECLGWLLLPNEVLGVYTVKHVWCGWRRLVGPPKRLLRVPILELVAVHAAWIRYTRHGRQQDLDEIVAILYRPVNWLWWRKIWDEEWTGDKRLPLNDYTLQRRKRKVAKGVSMGTKMAVVKQLDAAIVDLERRFPRLFSKSADGGDARGHGWMDILFAMSGGAFGNMRETERADAMAVLMKLDYDMIQQERMREAMKK